MCWNLAILGQVKDLKVTFISSGLFGIQNQVLVSSSALHRVSSLTFATMGSRPDSWSMSSLSLSQASDLTSRNIRV